MSEFKPGDIVRFKNACPTGSFAVDFAVVETKTNDVGKEILCLVDIACGTRMELPAYLFEKSGDQSNGNNV